MFKILQKFLPEIINLLLTFYLQARAEKRAKDMEILSNIKEASWFIENRSYAVYSTNYDSNDLSELMANRNEMNLYERIHKYAKEH